MKQIKLIIKSSSQQMKCLKIQITRIKIMKKIFNCHKCMYFPVSFESENFFLNSDTYKCPNCQQLKRFDKNQNQILETQFFVEEQLDNKNEKTQNNDDDQRQQLQKIHRNQEIVLILIQNSKYYTEGFYINPINPHLRNSLNIDKEQIIKQKNHHIFSLNNQFLRNNVLSFPNQSNFKYNKRKVSKAEHLFYCIDQYIKEVAQILIQQQKKSKEERQRHNFNNEGQNIKYIIISVDLNNNSDKGNIFEEGRQMKSFSDSLTVQKLFYDQKDFFANQSNKNHSSYRFQKIVQFDYSTYRQINKSNQLQRNNHTGTDIKDEQSIQTENQKFNEINQRFQKFFRSFYSIEQLNQNQGKIQNNNQNNKLSQQNEFSLKALIQNLGQTKCRMVSLFGDKINIDLMNQVCHSIGQKQRQKKIQQATPSNTVLVHSFQLTKNSQLNSKQNCQILQSLNPQVQIHHTCLYEPFNKQRITIHSLFRNVLKNSFQKNIRNLHSNMSFQQNSIQNPNPINQILNTSHSNNIMTHQRQIQNNFILIFFKQQAKNQQLPKISISQKLTNESLINLFKQLVLQIPKNQKQQSRKCSSTINNFMLPIIQQIKYLLKKNENLVFDRLVCQIDKKLIFYVFHFESIINDNYEQLDFLDQSSLPQELKNYSLTYENILPKKEPFKKLNKRVCLADFPQIQKSDPIQFSDESDQRESL